ncbi:MAG: hypothetical protein IPL26_16800 [Leptospiraceae bacterium]|nr:hypothetical protein [Leptospiraceae bacterium]
MENTKTRAEHIEAWKLSGLNRKEYALSAGLKYGTFKEWVYNRNKSSKRIEWKPIQIQEDESEDPKSFFELRLGGKWKFEINLRIRL